MMTMTIALGQFGQITEETMTFGHSSVLRVCSLMCRLCGDIERREYEDLLALHKECEKYGMLGAPYER